MKRIWAPWRMKYILQSRKAGCFLCAILKSRQDKRHLVLKRGKFCYLLANKYPYNNGHLMVAPYKHTDTLEDLRPEEMTEMMQLASDACKALRKCLRPDGFNLGLNIGAAAGAGLKDHLHLHIVPRWEGDTNFMPVFGEVKIIPQPLDELCRKMKKALT
jgi:ATP adenylyltransferase